LFTETSIRRSRQIPILVAFAVLLISMLVLIRTWIGRAPGSAASLARNVGMYGL